MRLRRSVDEWSAQREKLASRPKGEGRGERKEKAVRPTRGYTALDGCPSRRVRRFRDVSTCPVPPTRCAHSNAAQRTAQPAKKNFTGRRGST